MDYHLDVITEPTVEPVTAEQVKTYVHIDHSTEDAIIENWIKTARKLAENFQRRAYARQTLELSFDFFPAMPIPIPRPPLVSVRSFKYFDYKNTETSFDLSDMFDIDYNHEPGRIAFAYQKSWPSVSLRTLDCVKIKCVAGFDRVYKAGTTTESPNSDYIPAAVKDAIYLYCGYRNENRSGETPEIPKQFYDLLMDDRFYL